MCSMHNSPGVRVCWLLCFAIVACRRPNAPGSTRTATENEARSRNPRRTEEQRISGPFGECKHKHRSQVRPFGQQELGDSPRALEGSWEPLGGCRLILDRAAEFRDPTGAILRHPATGECRVARRFGGMPDVWLESPRSCSHEDGSRCSDFPVYEHYADFRQCVVENLRPISSTPSHWRLEWSVDSFRVVRRVELFHTDEADRNEPTLPESSRVNVPLCVRTILERIARADCSGLQIFRLRSIADASASDPDSASRR